MTIKRKSVSAYKNIAEITGVSFAALRILHAQKFVSCLFDEQTLYQIVACIVIDLEKNQSQLYAPPLPPRSFLTFKLPPSVVLHTELLAFVWLPRTLMQQHVIL